MDKGTDASEDSDSNSSPDADQPARVLERVSDGLLALDDELRLTYLNERAAELLDVDPAATAGKRLQEVHFETEGTGLDEPLREALETQETAGCELYLEEPGAWVAARAHPSKTGLTVHLRDVTARKAHEQALDFRTALLEAQAETTLNGHLVVDEDRTILYYNRRFAEIWGIPKEVLAERSDERALEFVLDSLADPEEFLEKVEYLYEHPSEESRDEVALADGRWLDRYSAPVVGEDGTHYGRLWTVRDITDRKERERELEQYRTLTQGASDVIVTIDGASTIRSVNPAVENFFGYDPDELIGEQLTVLMPDDHAARHLDALGCYLETGERTVDWDYVELPGERADGSTVPLAVSFSEVEHGDERFFTGIVRDVTERTEMEAALRERERQLSTLMDNVPGMVYRSRNERGWPVEFVSEGAVDLTGYDTGALEAGEVAWGEDIVVEADRDDRWKEIQDRVDDREAFEITYRIETADGDRRWVWEKGRGVYVDGDLEVLEGVVTDITTRVEYERQLEASNERLEQFAYAASHDLQEPLRMVSSYLSLLEQRHGDGLDDEAEEFLEFAVDSAERMKAMIDGLLEYSRVEGRGDPLEPVDLAAVLGEARRDLGVRIEESGAEVTADGLPRVLGDLDQLRQVFQNLLDNAIEYSGDEPPRVHVSATRDGDRWVVSVRDEGIGIDVDHHERVFDVFDRLHSHDEHEGTGIGLALCEQIVQRHGGDIWIDSSPGEGTTVSFTLPAADDEGSGDGDEE